MTTTQRIATAFAAVAILAVGCSSSPDEEEPAEEPAAAQTTEASTEDAATFEPVDHTAALDAAAGEHAEHITTATETEPGRFEVATTIVDPRTDGSAEAASAVAICEAAVELGAGYVSVLEEDGTTFVLYGHSSVPVGECAEV